MNILKRSFSLRAILLISYTTILFINGLSAQPTINALSILSGIPGAPVTIVGSNFNPNPLNNIVYFGSVRAMVSTVTPSVMTVSIPRSATYSPISIINTASALAAYSQFSFLPSYTNTDYIPEILNFQPKIDLVSGTYPFGTAITDIDGDGKPDIAVANFITSNVSVYRNNSSPGPLVITSFSDAVDFTTGVGPQSMLFADVDGDGRPEMIVANRNSSTISVFRNTSGVGYINAGSFNTKVDFVVGVQPIGLAVADFDKDGKPDIAVCNSSSASISVLRNTSTLGIIGSGTFALAYSFSTGNSPTQLYAGDLDGDNKPDIAVANSGANTITVYRNTVTAIPFTSGAFAPGVTFATGSQPWGIAASDLDADGRPDLITTCSGAAKVQVFKSAASSGSITSGSYNSPIDFATGNGPKGITIADFDGDRKPDLAIANSTSNSISVLRNTIVGSISTSSFATQAVYPTGTAPTGLSSCDLDGDGKPDITVANSGISSISIIQNMPLIDPPLIDSFSPANAYPGATVTIRGKRFNPATSGNIVSFGATRANVLAATDTSITVQVPVGATYSSISVSNTTNHLTGYSLMVFTPSYNNSPYLPSTENYLPEVPIITDTLPAGAAVGDVDGDGKPDLAITTPSTSTVWVYKNRSATGSITPGSFAAGVPFATGLLPEAVQLKDLNGDGKPELIVANKGGNSVSVLRNVAATGSITTSSFETRVDFVVGNGPTHLAIGDIDLDGKPDIATANTATNTISLLRNTIIAATDPIATGSFTSQLAFAAGTSPSSVLIADIDGDKQPDVLVATANGGGAIAVLRNTATAGSLTTATLAARVEFSIGSMPSALLATDIDGDTKKDVVAVSQAGNTVVLLHNIATAGTINSGSLAAPIMLYAPGGPTSIAAGDIDGDSHPDLATTNSATNTMSIFRNTASMGIIDSYSYATPVFYPLHNNPVVGMLADMDSDFKPDFIYLSDSGKTIGILKNDPIWPVTGDSNLCEMGGNTLLKDSTIGGIWTSSDTAVAQVDSNSGLVTGMAAGTATITYALPGGNALATVTVHALPQIADFLTASAATGCVNTPSKIWVFSATLGDGDFEITYDLSGANTGTDSIANITMLHDTGWFLVPPSALIAPGTTYVTLKSIKNIAGCPIDLTTGNTVTFAVNPLPDPISGTPLFCGITTATYTNSTTGGLWLSNNSAVATIDSSTGVINALTYGTALISYALPSGCYTMVTASVYPLPASHTITGGGYYCSGSGGTPIGLSSSQPGIAYQLYNGSAPTGTPLHGTGTAVSFGPLTAAGTYTILATDTTNTCSLPMSGSTTITIAPLPNRYTLTGGGNYCPGGIGRFVRLSFSDTSTEYQLFVGGSPVGLPVAGTGSSMSFGLQTTTGTYSVQARNTTTGCTNEMAATVAIAHYPLPVAYAVTGGGPYCAGGPGAAIGLGNSQTGVWYQLYDGTMTVGGPVWGTGSPIGFGSIPGASVYTVSATDTTTTCNTGMSGSVAVTITPTVTPTVHISASGRGDTSCLGVVTTYSATGTYTGSAPTYQWLVNGLATATGTTYSYTPAHADRVMVMLTSNAVCATPDTVTAYLDMYVSDYVTPSATITATPSDTVCLLTPATLTATTTFGGPLPEITWVKNGTHAGTGPTYSYTPANGDILFCTLTSDYPCLLTPWVYSNLVTMRVEVPVVPALDIVAEPGNLIAPGTSDTLTAVSTTAGSHPTYQWYLNGSAIAGATSYQYISNSFANGDSVSCVLTRTDSCKLSTFNSVVLTVANLGTTEAGLQARWAIVPNPNNGSFALNATLPGMDGDATITITNALGQQIAQLPTVIAHGQLAARITLAEDLPSGIYLIRLNSNGQSLTQRFIIGE